MAVGSEDGNFSQLQLRRNAHEEQLFKTEDEHFEIDSASFNLGSLALASMASSLYTVVCIARTPSTGAAFLSLVSDGCFHTT